MTKNKKYNIYKPKERILRERRERSNSKGCTKRTPLNARRAYFNKPLAIALSILMILSQSAIIMGGINTALGNDFDFGINRITNAAELSGYQSRFRDTTRGEIVFTGNALGLNTFQNIPGQPLNGSIDTYITTDTSLQTPGFPSGTTTDWNRNSSMAVADVPDDALVLYAELIWGANYRNVSNTLNIESVIDTPVTFTTPGGANTITPDTATASETDYGYIRTANVTELITPGVNQYTVGGVPGIIDPLDKSGNYAGWTLAIVYSQADLPIRNLSFYTGSEPVFTNQSDGETVEVTGFGTPLQGDFGSKIWISTQEGDSDLVGDQLQFGATADSIEPISGPNNLIDNFFAAQINNKDGLIDTRGTFGIRNQDLGVSEGGRRHGFDITAVDVTEYMSNGQTEAYIKGTSSGDIYVINALGVQIDVNAPNPIVDIVRDKEFVRVGETIKYDISVTNDGIIDGQNPTLNSFIPEGTDLVPGTFTIDGVATDLDPVNPIDIDDIAPGETQTYSFEVRVNSLPPSNVFENEAWVEYEYTPVAGSDVVREDTFSSKVVTFGLAPIGLPPVAQDDQGQTEPSTPITLDVVANDSDPDGNLSIPSIFITTPPSNGTATVDTVTGESTYTPESGFTGEDSYVYNICDTEGLCDEATVTITVRETTPPIAENDSATTKQGVPVNIPVLNNDTDPLNDPIDPSQITITVNPTYGTVSIDPTTGEAVYTPSDPSYVGPDIFSYEICNSDGCDPADVNITIGERIIPIAQDDTSTTKMNTPVDIPVLDNDTPGDGAAFDNSTPAIVPGSEPTNGTVSFDPTSGLATYTPGQDFLGNDTFQYTICNDQDECDQATVTVTIEDFLPPQAADDTATTPESQPVDIPVLDNDTEGDSPLDPTTTTVTTGPQNGSVEVNPTTGVTTYTPNPGFSGDDTYTYQICDQSDNCDTAVVVVSVTPLAPPQAEDDQAVTDEATPIDIPLLDNDIPGDGPLEPATTQVLDQPTNGTVSINPSDGVATYTPNPGYSGPDSFVYQVCDDNDKCDSANVSISVDEVLPPTANPDTISTLVNEPVDVPILSNDVDPIDGIAPDDFSSITVQPSNGAATYNPTTGLIEYIPDTDYVGSDTLNYEICNIDGCSETTVSINVNTPENPDAVDDVADTTANVPVTIPVLNNDTAGTDRVLDPTSLTVTTPAQNGTTVINTLDNTVLYTPDPGYTGTDTFSYEICNDANQCDEANVLVTVTAPPLPDAVEDSATTPQNEPVLIPILNNDDLPTGTDPANVTFLLDPVNGTITYDPATGVTYTPNPGFTGEDRFIYKICTPFDTCDSTEVKVTVTPINIPQVRPTRGGQVLGASEVVSPLPRTGGDTDPAVNALLVIGLLISAGFFTSLYFIKSQQL